MPDNTLQFSLDGVPYNVNWAYDRQPTPDELSALASTLRPTPQHRTAALQFNAPQLPQGINPHDVANYQAQWFNDPNAQDSAPAKLLQTLSGLPLAQRDAAIPANWSPVGRAALLRQAYALNPMMPTTAAIAAAKGAADLGITQQQARAQGVAPAVQSAQKARQDADLQRRMQGESLRHTLNDPDGPTAGDYDFNPAALYADPHTRDLLTAPPPPGINQVVSSMIQGVPLAQANPSTSGAILDYATGTPGTSDALNQMKGYGPGLTRGLMGFAEPESLAILAGTAGLGEYPIASKALLGGFASQAAVGAYQEAKQGDYGGALGSLTAFALPFALHGVKSYETNRTLQSVAAGEIPLPPKLATTFEKQFGLEKGYFKNNPDLAQQMAFQITNPYAGLNLDASTDPYLQQMMGQTPDAPPPNETTNETTPPPPPSPAPAPTETAPLLPPELQSPIRTETMNPADVGVNPILQYKKTGIVDPENQVTDALKGTDTYDVNQGGTWTVYRDEDGNTFALNSHHRRELAQRADRFVTIGPDGTPIEVPQQVPVRVLDAKDGWTPKAARGYGALENIRDGKGTALDALEVVNSLGITPDKFNEYGISTTGDMAKHLTGLQNLNGEALSRVQNGDITEAAAAGIGSVTLSPEAQNAATNEAITRNYATFAKGRDLANEYHEDEQSGLLAQEQAGQQTSMFGEQFIPQVSSTRGLRVELKEAATRGLTQMYRALLDPTRATLRPGEAIDAAGRKAEAAGMAENQAALKARIELLMQQDSVKAQIAQLAGDIGNGKATKERATAQLIESLKNNVRRSVADLADPTRIDVNQGRPVSDGNPSAAETHGTGGTDLFAAGHDTEPAAAEVAPAAKKYKFTLGEPLKEFSKPTYPILDAKGETIGHAAVTKHGTTAHIDWIGAPDSEDPLPPISNKIGTSGLKSLLEQYVNANPETTHIEGVRMGGSNYGNPEHVRVAVSDLLHKPKSEAKPETKAAPTPEAEPAVTSAPEPTVTPENDGYAAYKAKAREAQTQFEAQGWTLQKENAGGAQLYKNGKQGMFRSQDGNTETTSYTAASRKFNTVADPVKPSETSTPAPAPYKEQNVTRNVNGSMRDLTIRTFKGTTQAEYDAFLDALPSDAEKRVGRGKPTVNLDGRLEYSSFEYPNETPPATGKGGKAGASKALVDNTATDTGGALQSTVLPGAKEFAEQDIAPAVAGVKEGTAKLGDEMQQLLSPATRTPEAGFTARTFREKAGEMAQRWEQARDTFKAAKKMFDGMPEADRLDFIDKVETGQKQSTPELQKFADMLTSALDERVNEIQNFGKGYLENVIQNYFPHIWEDPAQAGGVLRRIFAKRPLEGSKSFMRQRSIPTTKDGMAWRVYDIDGNLNSTYPDQASAERAAKAIPKGTVAEPLKPVSTNPVELTLLKIREMDKFIMAQKVLNELKNTRIDTDDNGRPINLARFVRATEQAPEGWTKLDDRAAAVYGGTTVKVKEAFDQQIWDKLNSLVAILDKTKPLSDTRSTAIGGGGAWGLAAEDGSALKTKTGGDLSIKIHELGHILDARYDLWNFLQKKGANIRVAGVKKARITMSGELRNLADLRYEGQMPSDGYKSYVRTKPEKIANAITAYIYAPERMAQVAPTVKARLDTLIAKNPELGILKTIKPSLVTGERTDTQSVGGLIIRGHYYAPDEAAQVFNNYLSPGLRGNQWYDALRGAGNTMNQAQLGLSAFHLTFTAMDAAVSKFALGIEQAAAGKFKDAAGSIARVPLAPVENFLRGNRVKNAYENPDFLKANPDLAPIIKGIVQGGGRIKMDDFYHSSAVEGMWKAFRSGNYPGAAIRAPFAAIETISKPIMAEIVPRMKLGIFADLARFELSRLPADATNDQVRQVMARAWDSVDNRMGQLVYDNLFWQRATKDLAMLATRSLGWNIGTLREIGGGIGDTAAIPARVKFNKAQAAQAAANGTPYVPQPLMTHRMAYTMALPVVVGMAGALLQMGLTGQAPQDWKDLYHPRTGGTRPDGKPERVDIASYMKDVFAGISHPLTTLGHKANPLVSALIDMFQNKDFYGDQIRNEDDPLVQQALQTAGFAAKQFTPFTVLNSQKESGARGAAMSFVGLTPSPADVDRTPAEKMIYEYHARSLPAAGRTASEEQTRQAKQAIRQASATGGDLAGAARDAVQSGALTRQQVIQAARQGKEPTTTGMLKMLPVDEALNVYAAANDAEKQQWKKTVLMKIAAYAKSHGASGPVIEKARSVGVIPR